MLFKSKILTEAYKAAGWRERYAMQKGNKSVVYIHGEKCLKFTYDKRIAYQDENGSTYNVDRRAWIN